MATKWTDIVNSDAFKAETPQDQEAIRADFFDKVIAPQVQANGDDMEAVRQDFFSRPLPGMTQAPQQQEQPVAATQPDQAAIDAERGFTQQELDRGIKNAPEWAQGLREMVTGEDRSKGAAAGLPTIWQAKELGDPESSGDSLTDMLSDMWASVKNTTKVGAVGLFGGDEDVIKLAQSRGAKISQDEKGNVVASFPSGDYIINAPGLDAGDVMSGVSQIGLPVAATAATGGLAAIPSVLGRAAGMAAVDTAVDAAMGNVVEQAGGTEYTPERAAETAGLSGAANLISPTIGRAAKVMFGGGPAMTDSAKELITAADTLGVPLRTTELARAGELGEPTRVSNAIHYVSDILGGPKAGVKALQESTDKIPLVLGNADDVARYSDDALVSAFSKGKQQRVREAGSVFEEVKADMGDQAIPLNNTIREIDQVLDAWKRPGSTVDASDIKQMEKYRDSLMSGPQDLMLLRDNRTALRQELGSSMNLQMGKDRLAKAGKKIYDAMTKDMHEGVEAYAPNSIGKLKSADSEWASLVGDLGAPKVASAIKNGDINPEFIRENMAKFGSEDLNRIDRLLNDDGRRTLRAAISKNLDDAMKDAEGNIAPGGFTKAYDKHKALIEKFMPEKDAKQLAGIRKLMETSKGMKLASTNLSNGSILLPYIIGGAALKNPAILAGGIIANRAYNSIPVRNLLLKIAATEPASMKYNKLMRQLDTALLAQRERGERKDKGR